MMAFKNASRVHETCSNTPNAATAFNLSGAKTSARTFVAGVGDTNTCIYCAQAVDGAGAREADWEIGVGTVTDATPDTMARTQIIESSNTDAAVDFSSSTAVEIFTVDPASMIDTGGGYSNGLEAGIYHYPIIPTDIGVSANASSYMAVWYLPIVVARPIIMNAVTFQVNTASAGHSARVGLYAAEDSFPTDMLNEYGTVSVGTTGIKIISGLTHFIPPGNYFLALQIELNVAAVKGFGGTRNVGLWQGYGVREADSNNYHEGAITEASSTSGSFGTDLPNPAGSVGTFSRNPNGSAIVAYKFSEV